MDWCPKLPPAVVTLNLVCSCQSAGRGADLLLVPGNTSSQPSLSQDSSISQSCKHRRSPVPGSVTSPTYSLVPWVEQTSSSRSQGPWHPRPLWPVHHHCWICLQCPWPRFWPRFVCTASFVGCAVKQSPTHICHPPHSSTYTYCKSTRKARTKPRGKKKSFSLVVNSRIGRRSNIFS